MKFTTIVLACLAALLLCHVTVSATSSSLSPAESILLEASQRHSAAAHSDSETEVAVDSHILSDAEAEAEARFESDNSAEVESAQEVDAEELAAAEEAAAMDADAEIEDRMDMDADADADAESNESFAEMDSESADDLEAEQQDEFLTGQSALLEVSRRNWNNPPQQQRQQQFQQQRQGQFQGQQGQQQQQQQEGRRLSRRERRRQRRNGQQGRQFDGPNNQFDDQQQSQQGPPPQGQQNQYQNQRGRQFQQGRDFQQGPPPQSYQGGRPQSFQGPPPSNYHGPNDQFHGPPPSSSFGRAPFNFNNAPQSQLGGGAPFGRPSGASAHPIEIPTPIGASAGTGAGSIPLPPGTNPYAPFPFKDEKPKKNTVLVKIPNPAAPGKFLKVRVPVPTKGSKLAKKMEKGKGQKALAKQMKKALAKALGKKKLSKGEKKAVKKAAKKAVKKAKKAAKKAKKAKKKAKKKAAKKAKKARKKLSKKALRAQAFARAATKAATLNADLLPKAKYTKRWTTIQVPNPAKSGTTTSAKVQVQVPLAGTADDTLKSIKAVVPKVELRKLTLPGSSTPKEIKVTRYFKALRQAVVDPINPGAVRTIDVQVEVKAPPKKPARAIEDANKLLEAKISKVSKSIKRLEGGLKTASRNVADSPVLEDGAPAPPDRQQIEMAGNLMKVLEATVMHKAKAIGEKYLSDARDMTVLAAANHEAVQDFNIRMNAENILPKDF